MSLEYIAVVLNHSKAAGTDKLVLLGIANHADPEGVAYPGVPRLARYANVQQRAVQKCLGRLVAAGELTRSVQQGGDMTYDDYLRPNRYVIEVECPEGCDRSPQHKPRPGWTYDDELGEYVRLVDADAVERERTAAAEAAPCPSCAGQGWDPLDPGEPCPSCAPLSTGDTPETHDSATRRENPVSARTPGVRTDRGGDVRTDTQTVNINHQVRGAVSAQRSVGAPRDGDEKRHRPQLDSVRESLRASSARHRQREKGWGSDDG